MAEPLTRIGVCGAGAMGSGIAEIAAQREAEVRIFDVSADALKASETRAAGSLSRLVDKGKLTREDADATLGRMRGVGDLPSLADCTLVIEAVIEDAGVKTKLFAGLEEVLARDAVIATNTSSLSSASLAGAFDWPDRFCGMHFFNPATVMKLVEIVSGPATDPDVAARVLATAESLGKVAIPVADVPGFIVNRVARPFYGEAFTALTERAAEPHAIDALFRAVGFRMGPLELSDLIGQDVNFAVARSLYDAYFGQTRFVPQLAQGSLVDAGWLGRKSGRGVFRYDNNAPEPSFGKSGQGSAADRALADKVFGADGLVEENGVLLGATRGRTARHEAREAGKPVALFDFSDPAGDGLIAFAASDDEAEAVASQVVAGLGRPAVRIADRPGLIVSRTLAQIANAAADAVFEHVADEAGIDAALRYGANYPFGPFAFADRFGRDRLAEILTAIAASTGQAMYTPSQYWNAG